MTFSCSGTITLTAEIVVSANTTIDGSGQTVTISGNNAVRVFTVNSGVAFTLNALTIANGTVREYGSGGGIYIPDGTLTVSNCTFSGNSALGGGGIYKVGGAATLRNSTFTGNRALQYVTAAGTGGGILNDGGTLTVRSRRSTIQPCPSEFKNAWIVSISPSEQPSNTLSSVSRLRRSAVQAIAVTPRLRSTPSKTSIPIPSPDWVPARYP